MAPTFSYAIMIIIIVCSGCDRWGVQYPIVQKVWGTPRTSQIMPVVGLEGDSVSCFLALERAMDKCPRHGGGKCTAGLSTLHLYTNYTSSFHQLVQK